MSDFVPSAPAHPIETFISVVRRNIGKLRTERERESLKHPNLTTNEIRAMKSLTGDPRLTIKPADKGGAIDLHDTSQNIAEALRQLADTEEYHILPSNPKLQF